MHLCYQLVGGCRLVVVDDCWRAVADFTSSLFTNLIVGALSRCSCGASSGFLQTPQMLSGLFSTAFQTILGISGGLSSECSDLRHSWGPCISVSPSFHGEMPRGAHPDPTTDTSPDSRKTAQTLQRGCARTVERRGTYPRSKIPQIDIKAP